MARHGNNGTSGEGGPGAPPSDPPVWQRGSFPGAGGDAWYRALTGRQAPEPISAKLRMIYGNVVAEALPDRMLDLLSRLDQKSVE